MIPLSTQDGQLVNNYGKIIQPNDGDGQELNEGDRVCTYDVFTPDDAMICGTLRRNTENPEVAEWYVEYDDGEDCAVLDFSLLFKTLK